MDVKGWELNSSEFPLLDITIHGSRSLRLRMNYEDWPERPPSAELLEVSGAILNVPPFTIFNMSPHPITGRPFICMRGFNEYHTHPSHLDVLWENHRYEDGNNLIGLLEQVSRSWRRMYPR
jgi:hypothetical protein